MDKKSLLYSAPWNKGALLCEAGWTNVLKTLFTDRIEYER